MSFAEYFLSPQLCGFQKGFNMRCYSFLETCKTTMDNGGFAGELLIDFSKAFDFLNHEVPLAKLHGYGFDGSALALIHSYNHCQKSLEHPLTAAF